MFSNLFGSNFQRPFGGSIGPILLFSSLLLAVAVQRTARAGELLSAQQASAVPTTQEVTSLEIGKPIERELSGGQKHSYKMAISEGQFVRVEIRPQGISISATLAGPDGKAISRVGHPFGFEQEPAIDVVAEVTGVFRLDIYTGARASGRYEIRVAHLRPATENDQALYQARKSHDESLRLNREGKHLEARSFLIRALEIRENILGPNSLLVAVTLDYLSGSFALTGDYASAVTLRERALDIKENIQGPEHPDVAYTLLNLGIGYQEKGDGLRAEEMFQRALGIYEKANQTESLYVSSLLGNLGDAYYYRGDYENAERYYQRSRGIQERILGPDHFHLAGSFAALGLVAYAADDYAKAEATFKRALTLYEKTLGQDHIRISRALNNLAMVYATTRDFAKAEELYRRSLSIHEQKASIGNLDSQDALFGLARVYEAQGLISEAVKFQTRASEIEERYLDLNLAAGSERDKLSLLASLSAHAFRNISLHSQEAPNDPVALKLALTTVLQRKGRTQDSISTSFAALRHRFGGEDQKLLIQLNDVTSRLAKLVLNGPQKVTTAEHQAQIKKVEEERERLEGEISSRTAGFLGRSQSVVLDEIQAAIPDHAALVEFAIYQPFDAKAPDNEKAFGEPHYIVYVLRKQGQVLWRELGETARIDGSISALRQSLLNPKRKNVKQLARALDEKVMQPVRALTGDATQLIVSPDGALNLIPFEALVDARGKYLVEDYSFSYLTSGRDLLRRKTSIASKTGAVVMADPVFGEPEIHSAERPEPSRMERAAHGRKRQSVTTGRDLSNVYFASLSGTANEARAIKSLFPEANIFTGALATELALKQTTSPRILHLATHGFFLTDAASPVGSSGTRAISARTRIENPLLRSGLALTGANLRNNAAEDGILTALEAAGLNLLGTKLVTLSACDTGLGEVKNGEGVYGLRRAFVLAGTESLVMSLWPVSDYVTRELMTSYYKGLKEGQGRGEAMRRVRLNMLQRKERQHPFYWASFIQSGEWANLDGKR